MAVAISAEKSVMEIYPELNRMYWTIKLVLNLTLRPRPINSEYLVPSNLWKSRKEPKSFDAFATSQMSTISNGDRIREAKETFAPILKKKSGERNM